MLTDRALAPGEALYIRCRTICILVVTVFHDVVVEVSQPMLSVLNAVSDVITEDLDIANPVLCHVNLYLVCTLPIQPSVVSSTSRQRRELRLRKVLCPDLLYLGPDPRCFCRTAFLHVHVMR